MPVLILEHSGKRKRAALNGRATIGRTPENDLVIDHPAVSRTHAIIESDAGEYFISDTGSKNGTIVGEPRSPLAANSPTAIGLPSARRS